MLWLYRLLFAPALIVLLPSYWRRMRRRGGYGRNFSQRFGFHRCPPRGPAPRVWLQAVSVGEMMAIGPLLRELRARGIEVYLTTTTSTGFRVAQDRHAAVVLGIGYFPLDWWPFSRLAWRRIAPDAAVLMEGERWPEHLHQARRRKIRTVCVNARLSERSFRRLRRFPPAARLVLDGIDELLASSAAEAAHFAALGFPAARLSVSGNLKFDVAIAPLSDAEKAALRRALGLPADSPVLVGASTWPGEEAALVGALRAARAGGRRLALLIVPRHAERRDALAAELKASGLRVHFRSRGDAPGTDIDVAVADTTGELQRLLQLGDLVFVGKSLPPHTEGQTPVEAAALGRPLLFGPGMSNFRGLAPELLRRGAAREVADAAALAAAVCALLDAPEARAALAAQAAAWHADNRGAASRALAAIYRAVEAKGA